MSPDGKIRSTVRTATLLPASASVGAAIAARDDGGNRDRENDCKRCNGKTEAGKKWNHGENQAKEPECVRST